MTGAKPTPEELRANYPPIIMHCLPKLVYVAGPMKHDDMGDHLRTACIVATEIESRGGIAYLPQLDYFRQLIVPMSPQYYLEKDKRWLELCRAVLRLPGKSDGADAEVKLANELGKLVFHDIDDCLDWLSRT